MTSSAPANTDAQRRDCVELALPLRAEFASTLRVVVSSIAADAGFSVDEIDDLRLAVSEVFNVLSDSTADANARVSAAFTSTAAEVEVELRCDDLNAAIELDPLALTILSSVVDRYDIGDRTVVLAKRATESAAPPD